MSSQPLYRIVYADGSRGVHLPWTRLLFAVARGLRYAPFFRWGPPVRVERVSPAPPGGE